ncbi:MAG: hypothetical protein GXY13_02200 [Acidimicrobiales bacterium]|nr:hypothetical protein [Acidimicrobiales bacterium]
MAVGAIAVFLIYGYVGSVKDEAFADAERVKVFVVETTVTRGTYGEEAETQKLIVESEIPKKFFPENAIRTFDDIAGKVAIGDLAINQIVTNDMFAEPGLVQSSFADRLEQINETDQVAVTISVDQVHGVAGVLQPGDYVNIMATDLCEVEGVGAGAGGSGGTEGTEGEEQEAADDQECRWGEDVLFGSQARVVYQKVQVLAVGQTPVPLPGESTTAAEGEEASAGAQNTGLITFIVPAEAAQRIASLRPETIYLALVARDYTPVPQGPIDPASPLPAENPADLTPYGPAGPGGE